jgi:hypothetical protein
LFAHNEAAFTAYLDRLSETSVYEALDRANASLTLSEPPPAAVPVVARLSLPSLSLCLSELLLAPRPSLCHCAGMAQKHSARNAGWRIKASDALLPKRRSRQLPQPPWLLLLSPLLMLLLSRCCCCCCPRCCCCCCCCPRKKEGGERARQSCVCRRCSCFSGCC